MDGLTAGIPVEGRYCSCSPCGGSLLQLQSLWTVAAAAAVPVDGRYCCCNHPCGGSLLQLQGSNREWWWWPQEDILTGVTRKLIRVGAATDIDGARGLKRWPCRAGLKRWSCMCM